MTDHNEQFIPASVDEQISQLQQFSEMHKSQDASHSALPPEAQLIRDLRTLHSKYAETRDRVWERLAEQMAQQKQQAQPEIPSIQSFKKHPYLYERYLNMQENIKQRPLARPRPVVQHFAQLAAVFVVVVLVGSMLWVFNLTRHSNSGTAASPQSVITHTVKPAVHLDCTKPYLDHGWYDVCSHGEVQVINQAKPLHDKVVTVKAAYADGNRIIISYAIKYSSGDLTKPWQADMTSRETLTLLSGQELMGEVGASAPDFSTKTYNWVTSFSASNIPAQTGILRLRLDVSVMSKPNDVASFDFSLPFHAARVANLNQTVTENGIPITLQTIRVSRSETVINLLSLPLATGATMTSNQPGDNLYYVTVNGWSSKGSYILPNSLNQVVGDKHTPVIGVQLILNEPLFTKSGQWTLHISHNAIAGAATDWVFNFSVPQA